MATVIGLAALHGQLGWPSANGARGQQQQSWQQPQHPPTKRLNQIYKLLMNNILSFDLNCSDFIILNCDNLFGRILLLDTQADISVIKQGSLTDDTFILTIPTQSK